MTDEQAMLIASFTLLVQDRLDRLARSWGYDNIVSLASYQGDEDAQFNAEGEVGKRLRSQTWKAASTIFAAVMSEQRSMPETFADIESDLPPLPERPVA